MASVNLAQLSFVDAVASEGSFTLAAAQCHVTQPTLSNGIRQLEEELGGRLFERTTRSVRLTDLGQQLLPYVREVLNAQKMLLSQTQALLHPAQQLIRVGTSPLISSTLLGLMLEPFRRAHGEVDIVLREMNMTDLYRMLEAGLLDYTLGVVDAHKARWRAAPLYEEPLLFIPPGAAPLPGRRASVSVEDIANETFVMVPEACGLARTTRALFRRRRKKLLEYPGQAMGYRVLEEWAELKIGAAILPKSKVTSPHAYPIKDKAGKEMTIAFEAVWLGAQERPPHLIAFERHLRHVVPGIVRGVATE
jgi:LysR family hydrogen peroxide-inducible transcriptional activator